MRLTSRVTSEAEFQRYVCDLLDVHERLGQLSYFAVPNGMYSHPIAVEKMKRQGLRPGMTDLVVLFPPSRAHFWELKKPGFKGLLKGNQFLWQKRLILMGFEHRIIASIDDAVHALKVALGSKAA